MFDLSQFQTDATTFVHLKSPIDDEPLMTPVDGEEQPVGITLHTPGSEAHEAALAYRQNRLLHRAKRKVEVTAKSLLEDTIALLTDLTVSFDNLAFSPAGDATGKDLFKALYADRKFAWVIEQINTHLADIGRFTKGSVKN